MLKLFMKSNIRLFVCHDTLIQWVWLKLLINNRTCFNKMPPLISIQSICMSVCLYIIVKDRQGITSVEYFFAGEVIINNGNH